MNCPYCNAAHEWFSFADTRIEVCTGMSSDAGDMIVRAGEILLVSPHAMIESLIARLKAILIGGQPDPYFGKREAPPTLNGSTALLPADCLDSSPSK